MPFTTLTAPAVGDPTKRSLAQGIIDNLTYLNGAIGGGAGGRDVVLNGSFEADADSDGIPDNWTRSTYTGGTFSRVSTANASGKYAVKFTRPTGGGNGGGYIETTEFLECREVRPFWVRWSTYSTVAGVKNQVVAYWFDKDQAALGTPTTTIWESTSNPTSWECKKAVAIPPTTARYFKLRFVCGYTDTDVATADIFLDDVGILEPIPTDYDDNSTANYNTGLAYGNTGWSVDLPCAGTYLLTAQVGAFVAAAEHVVARLYDNTAGAAIGKPAYADSTHDQILTLPLVAIFTTTQACTVTLQGKDDSALTGSNIQAAYTYLAAVRLAVPPA